MYTLEEIVNRAADNFAKILCCQNSRNTKKKKFATRKKKATRKKATTKKKAIQ